MKFYDWYGVFLSLNSSLTLDYSNASEEVQNVNALLQNLLDKFYPMKKLEALVPTMTSNTSAICSFSVSSTYTGSSNDYSAYKAHDGNDDTYWCSDINAVPAWLKITFEEPKTVKKIFIMNWFAQKIVFQASNDGNSWTDLTTITPNLSITQDIDNIEAYKYYRFYSSSGYTDGGTYFIINDFQLYGY